MSERANLQQELEAVLRARGAAAWNLNVVSDESRSSYRQFSLHLDLTMLGDFASLYEKISFFAVCAHAQQVSDQVSSKFDAWGRVKRHARMYLDAPTEAPFDRRGVIGGMANAFGRSLFAMGRARYAFRWPPYLRIEFVTLWQEVSTARVTIFG